MAIQSQDDTLNAVDMPKWKPYPEYKDSGIEWLYSLPSHWQAKKLKYLFTFCGGGTPSKDNPAYWNGEIPWVSPKDMKSARITDTEDHISSSALEESATSLVAPGAVLVVVRSGILRHTLPVAINDVTVSLNQDMKAMNPIGALKSEYLQYLIAGQQAALLVEWRKQGATVESLEHDLIADTKCPVPPIPEQRAIADFLDRETARIDALISKKERLIELLNEKRTAVISHAVTKGLDPTAPMKDSGVEWLGQIPAHWEVLPLKRISHIRYGLGQPPPEASDGLPLIRATNVTRGRITEEGMMYIDPADVPAGKDAFLRAGEIIVVRSGAYTGDSALVSERYAGSVAGYDMVVGVRQSEPRYHAWQFLTPQVYELQFGLCKLRAAQPHLNAEELGDTLLTVPPVAEQQCIADFVDHQTAGLDLLIQKTIEHIDLLREYRTALISAAVTGKIDVREVAQ